MSSRFDFWWRFDRYLRPKAAAGNIDKHAVAQPSNINGCRPAFGDQCERIEQIASRDTTGGGEVIGSAERQEADRAGHLRASGHNAIDDLVECAITSC